jgi:hypothetical protein
MAFSLGLGIGDICMFDTTGWPHITLRNPTMALRTPSLCTVMHLEIPYQYSGSRLLFAFLRGVGRRMGRVGSLQCETKLSTATCLQACLQ